MTTMLTPEAARRAIARVYDRRFATWAVSTAAESSASTAWLVDRPLHPPAERTALAEPARTSDWIAAWRRADPEAGPAGHVVWADRAWASMGTQILPARLRLGTPDTVARFAGRRSHWLQARRRADRLVTLLRTSAADDAVRDAVSRVLGAVVDLDDTDVDRLFGVLEWVLRNDTSGLYVRQVPVRGVDTKWLERHRRIVETLYRAASGREGLGLAARPALLRVRFLDHRLAPGGLRDVTVPVAELAALDLAPPTVVVVENLETLLAMPDRPGVVAVHGQGYAARHLPQLPWIRHADVVYWGDLDTDGLNILSAVRSRLPQTRSILMDRDTLTAHRDLAVADPRPRRTCPDHLTGIEADAFMALSELGDLRLEQERIPWALAVAALDEALRRPAAVVVADSLSPTRSAGPSS